MNSYKSSLPKYFLGDEGLSFPLVSSLFVQLSSLACEPLNLLFIFSLCSAKSFWCLQYIILIASTKLIFGFLLSLFLLLLYVFFIFCCFVQVICQVRTYFLCLVNILSHFSNPVSKSSYTFKFCCLFCVQFLYFSFSHFFHFQGSKV